jgi:hypothetical protein
LSSFDRKFKTFSFNSLSLLSYLTKKSVLYRSFSGSTSCK